MISPRFKIRALGALDLPQVLAIDRACASQPWSRDDYVTMISGSCQGRVAADNPFILGFIIYTISGTGIVLGLEPAWTTGNIFQKEIRK